MEVGVVGRRGLAVVASLALLGSSLLPPAHRHLAPSLAGHPVAAAVHQHLSPHHNADHDRTRLHDDDDDRLVQLVELAAVGTGVPWHHPPFENIRFQPSLGAADETRGSAFPASATASPPEPPIPTRALRAPPA